MEAQRQEIEARYDLIEPEFEKALATLMAIGGRKYGDANYKRSRLTGNRSPINHIKNHLQLYCCKREYDHPELGVESKFHLISIAANAMMEFWYECQKEGEK